MLYIFYTLMSIILLLNMLIAMMGDTYSNTRENSQIEWRVSFARLVRKYEMLLQPQQICGRQWWPTSLALNA